MTRLVAVLSLAACLELPTDPDGTTSDATDRTDVSDSGTPTTREPPEEPIPEQGASAGALSDVDARRAAFDAIDPPEPWNPNELALAPGTHSRMPILDAREPTRVEPKRLTVAHLSPTVGRTPWNGHAGQLAAQDYVQTDYNSNWPFPEGREACVEPDIMADCCTYTLTEGEDGAAESITYYSPNDLYATEADAAAALREVYAQRPIFLPFTDGDVRLGHGWSYNNGDPHGSLDYSQTPDQGDDPAFRVRAVADGTVVAKFWHAWHGNVLIIEHPAVPGQNLTYRSHYFHLRNGKDNDLNMAQTRTSSSNDPDSARARYLLAANKENPSDLFWGTNAQTIPVDVGDTVRAHQLVGWSGNTGPGGAGAGLDVNGDPTNPTTSNNHLHFMLSVSHPDWTGGDWLYVDPYGVYDQQDNGCYDLVDNTEYDRLFAPFYPYFHGVDLGVFNHYLYYYGQMGRSPMTFTVQRNDDGDVVAAGAFKTGGSASWYVYDYLKADDFDERWNELVSDDFRLADRSVTLDSQGTPRHNGLFRPDTLQDWVSIRDAALPGEWVEDFDHWTGQGYALTDFFAYHDGSDDLAAAIFEKPASGGMAHHANLTSAEFTTTTNDLAADGWYPTDVNLMELHGTTRLSAIYQKTGDHRMVHWGMSATEYQQWTNFYLSEGWDLMVVQNYADGERYAAIYAD